VNRSLRRHFALVGGLSVLLMIAACSEESTTPAPTNDLPPAAASAQAEAMVSVVTDMVSMSDNIAAGDFNNIGMLNVPSAEGSTVRIARADFSVNINYDEAAGRWTVSSTGSDSMGTSYSASYVVQFRDEAGNAQVEPGPTTASVSYAAELSIDSSFSDPESGVSSVAAFDYNADVSMTGLQTGPVQVVANGDMSGSFSGTDGQNSFDYALAVNWDLDVSIPFDGCPTGSANINFGPYSATVTYDGTNQASWGAYQGTTLLDSGFETMDCGALAK
jgi:predicted secreted protein